jgi:hypothetical protein
MTDKEKVSKLSKLLEDLEEQVRHCDELDPWGGTETRGAFLEVSAGGALLIAKLHQIDQNIMVKSRRLKSISQLHLENLLKLKLPPTNKTLTRWLRTWGQMLEVTEDLRDATVFCASLAKKEKTWLREQEYRIKFKECSQKLAGYLLYDLLDVLAEYDPEEYSSLRLQVLCSYLKELRVEFLWDAHVRGPCRTDSIPRQCLFEKLPDSLKGELSVLHGEDQHELAFQADTGKEFKCLINNIGIKNYRALLDSIWDRTTGKLHAYPQDGSAVWAITKRESIQNLEGYASLISRLLRPLSVLPKYSERARAIRAIIRSGRGCWAKASHIKWSYLYDLDKCIVSVGNCLSTP